MRSSIALLMGKTILFAASLAGVLFLANGTDLSGQIETQPPPSLPAQQENDSPNSKTAQTLDTKSNNGAKGNTPATVEEARIRAQILHEAFSGALQVMHRDYFREDQKLKLPSKSLEDVFSEMARSQNVELRWLAVNATAMSVDHKPQNDFEKAAVAALSSGKNGFEAATADSYKFVGSIRLSASCVKCHVRNRTSNAERKAGLVITMPLKTESKK